jgi:hypothetical protein
MTTALDILTGIEYKLCRETPQPTTEEEMKSVANGIQSLLGLSCVLVLTAVMAGCSAAGQNGASFPSGVLVSEANEDLEYRFTSNGTWSYHAFGLTGAEGRYTVKGNVWTEKGGEDCPFPGSYEWTFDGSHLSFKLIGEDKCDPRREATDGQVFVLQQ